MCLSHSPQSSIPSQFLLASMNTAYLYNYKRLMIEAISSSIQDRRNFTVTFFQIIVTNIIIYHSSSVSIIQPYLWNKLHNPSKASSALKKLPTFNFLKKPGVQYQLLKICLVFKKNRVKLSSESFTQVLHLFFVFFSKLKSLKCNGSMSSFDLEFFDVP